MSSCASKKKTAVTNNSRSQSNEERAYAAYFYEACREKTLGNIEAASNLFSKCIQINPNNPSANYELAYLYAGQNKIPEASIYAQAAYEKESTNVWYAMLYSSCLQRKEKYSEAAEIIKKSLNQNPERIDLYYEYASSLLMSGKYKKAIAVYDDIEKRTGSSEEVSLQKQRIYLKLGQLDKAAKEIEKLIQQNPNEAKYYGLLAELYGANGQNQKAFETLNRILTIDPDNGYVRLSLADYYRAIGQKDKSYNELKLAMGNAQVDMDTKMRIMLSYYDLTQTDSRLKDQAQELIEILRKTHPEDARAHAIAGDFYYRDKKTKEARDAYKNALEFDKDKFVIWTQILLIDGELNDFEDMLDISTKAKELFPAQPAVLLFNGISNIQKKNYQAAIASLKEGAALIIDNDAMLTQVYAYLGDSYHAVNDDKNSDEAYEKALKADSNNIYVLNNYSYYLSVRKENLERAAEMSFKTLRLQPNLANYEDTYAWILYQQKKYAEAVTWLERAIKNGGGGNPTILEHLGDTYFKINNLDAAVENWVKAKNITPSESLESKIKNKKTND